MSEIIRLSPQQSRRVNSLVKRECCNCDGGNCLLLDDGGTCICPQLISYSLLCKWFRNAVLPADKELYVAIYKTDDRRRCAVCGEPLFPAPTGRNIARIAGSDKDANRPQSVCANCAPMWTFRGLKSLVSCGFAGAKLEGEGVYT